MRTDFGFERVIETELIHICGIDRDHMFLFSCESEINSSNQVCSEREVSKSGEEPVAANEGRRVGGEGRSRRSA